MPDWRERFLNSCARIEGAAIGEGAFAPGPAVWVGSREVAHFDGEDILDVRLTREAIRARRAELKEDETISLRSGTSDWVRVRVTSDNEDRVLALVAEAVASNLPTAPAGPPPTGAALSRRRRFH